MYEYAYATSIRFDSLDSVRSRLHEVTLDRIDELMTIKGLTILLQPAARQQLYISSIAVVSVVPDWPAQANRVLEY